jgi:hypothetical protein
MADIADSTDHFIDLVIQFGINKVLRSAERKISKTCDICGDDLNDFRQKYGRCVSCQQEIELKDKLGLRKQNYFDY